MGLQAYFDDSGSEPQSPTFVLAGFIAPEHRWARFADEWREAMAKPPGVAYFKTTEAVHLRGEFSADKGWSRDLRDARIVELSEIIWRHASISLSAMVRHADFEETVKLLPPYGGKRTLANDHPYIFLYYHLISELWLHAPQLGLSKGPCAFIFDQQLGFEAEARRFWLVMEAAMKHPPAPPWANWINSPPTFADDKVALPLQAADLYAWSNRRAVCHPHADLKLPDEALANLTRLPERHLHFTRDVLLQKAMRGAELLQKHLSLDN
jgi:hypothetical protein